MEPIQDVAKRWLRIDQDDASRQEIEDLLADGQHEELESRLRKRIAFGTAGLRASMKAGFAHMNAVTVLQASQGLADYIVERQSTSYSQQLAVVVGYDGRHNSEVFARRVAATFMAKGFKVYWFGRLVHTPLVPFAVGYFEAAAGVMITASHNPKNDNGYKVYWSNGCQIIPPHDTGIAKCIDQQKYVSTWEMNQNLNAHRVDGEVMGGYMASLITLPGQATSAKGDDMPFVYTPMHGVGLPFMQQAMYTLGLDPDRQMHIVQAQAGPDPDFPTIPFPNPEEHGALDLAISTAEENNCRLILANDPDADRFAVAEHLPDGTWQQLTGNQMGVLLASHVFETYTGPKDKLAMLASTVSSRMLSAMAKKEGFHFQETLTGFKWLGNVAQTLKSQGYKPAFAYEEAIGYMFPSVVWDKDGIAAAMTFLMAWQRWQQEGLTPWTKLQTLYEKYGYFEDANTYLISPSPDVTNAVFADIRLMNAGNRPEKLGSRTILRWRDLTLGFDTASEDHKPDLPVDPTAQMVTCELDGVVFTVRGSGTEPKIKLYIEGTGDSSAKAKAKATEVLRDLLDEWFIPHKYGLKLAGS